MAHAFLNAEAAEKAEATETGLLKRDCFRGFREVCRGTSALSAFKRVVR